MRRFVLCLSCSALLLLVVVPTFAQNPVSSQPLVRDPQALALLQASAAAMGKSLPNDSTAIGSITTVAGSTTDSGTIRILTKGTNETAVEVQTSSGASWSLVYSNGQANKVDATGNVALPLEQVASSQSNFFPLSVITGILTSTDACYQYVGLETVDGGSAQHIRVWNSFNSTPNFRFLANFTVMDIRLDAASGLPSQISFVSRSGGGASPRIPITVSYSKYQNVTGILYPNEIQESINGTLWATITIESVVFNTGLSDSSFPVTAEAN